tara:strand:- start:131 stop:601 length:471 start_codon:yes stop_codon:yes gene_type:complete
MLCDFKQLSAEERHNELEKEIIEAVLATQNEAIEAYKEFKNTFNHSETTIFLNKFLHNHQINKKEISKYKPFKNEKDSLIDYEIPPGEFDTKEKIILFLIDLEETNIQGYSEALIEIKDYDLKKTLINIILNDITNLTLLNYLLKKEDITLPIIKY